jgi:hypothetical protein
MSLLIAPSQLLNLPLQSPHFVHQLLLTRPAQLLADQPEARAANEQRHKRTE